MTLKKGQKTQPLYSETVKRIQTLETQGAPSKYDQY